MFWILVGILFQMGRSCSGSKGTKVPLGSLPRGRNRPRHRLALLGPTDLPNAVKNYENTIYLLFYKLLHS